MKTLCILLLILNSCVCLYGFLGGRQSVAVEGTLICDEEPASGVKVKLFHKKLLLNRRLAQGVTNENGMFSLNGSALVLTHLRPVVNVYHKCNYTGYCYRKFGVSIPETFITDGATPARSFDVGTINLGPKFKGETISCFN